MAGSRKHDLESAYALETPEESAAFYRDWARRYDREFADDHGYAFPDIVARAYAAEAGETDAPILDVGAGTGLVAAALGERGVTAPVDAVDISPEMLEVAAGKGLYRDRIAADLTGTLPIADASYGALVASGIFTHGHVGPVCLPELMRVARPGALCAFGINPGVFDSAGFGSAFALLVAEGRITPVRFVSAPIYEGADHEHAADTGLLALFRTTC